MSYQAIADAPGLSMGRVAVVRDPRLRRRPGR